MKINNYHLIYRIIGWPFLWGGLICLSLLIVKMHSAFEFNQLWGCGIIFCFIFIGWCLLHSDYCHILPNGIECCEAKLFSHSKLFIPIDKIEKIELEEKVMFNRGRSFLEANIVLYGKNNYKFEIKEFGPIKKQKILLEKIKEKFLKPTLICEKKINSNQLKCKKKSQLKVSVEMIKEELGQLTVGLIGSILLLTKYFTDLYSAKTGIDIQFFMILWAIVCVYKIIRYRIHLNKMRKIIFGLTKKMKTQD